MNASTALIMISQTEFSPFDKIDFHVYSGVESNDPLIGYNGDWAIVIDGDIVLFEKEAEWFQFNLNLTSEH